MTIRKVMRNRKAFHDYEVLEKYESGICLVGTEVKSIRAGKCNLTDGFCLISDKFEMELLNVHVSPYDFGNRSNHQPDRKRKLLMHKQEMRRIRAKVQQKGLSLIPLKIYFKRNHLKVEIGLCKGKKIHDKRDSLREADITREMDRSMKYSGKQ